MADKKDRLIFSMPSPKNGTQFVPPENKKEHKSNWNNFDKPSHLYSSGRWQKLRIKVLTENPMCYFGEHIATQVHHIHRDEDLFFEIKYLVSICDDCHDKVNSAYRRKIDKEILFGERGRLPCQE